MSARGQGLPRLSSLIDVPALRRIVPSSAELALHQLSGATIDNAEADRQFRLALQDAQDRWSAATRRVPLNVSRRWLAAELAAALRAGGLLELTHDQANWILGVRVEEPGVVRTSTYWSPATAATLLEERVSRPGWMGPWHDEPRRSSRLSFGMTRLLGLAPKFTLDFEVPPPRSRASVTPWDTPEAPIPALTKTRAPRVNNRLTELVFELALYGPALIHESARHLHWGREQAGLMDPVLRVRLAHSSWISEAKPRYDCTGLLPSAGQELLGDIWNPDDVGSDWLSQSLERTLQPAPVQSGLSELSGLNALSRLGMGFATAAPHPSSVPLRIDEQRELGKKLPRTRLGAGSLGWNGPARSGISIHVQWGGARTTLKQLRAALEGLRRAELSDAAARICLALQVAPEQCPPEVRPARALAREAGRDRTTWPV